MTARPGAISRKLCGFSGRSAAVREGVDDLPEAMGGRTAIIYEYHAGSVAYFAPEAPDFCEAGELKGEDIATTQRILDERCQATVLNFKSCDRQAPGSWQAQHTRESAA